MPRKIHIGRIASTRISGETLAATTSAGAATNAEPDGREYFAASVTPTTINDEQRTVDVVWFTGIDISRCGWDGPYTRRFDPKGLDLSLLNNGAPVFDNHNTYDGVEAQKGVVEKAWTDGDLYKATLRFSKRASVDPLWQDVKDKIVQKFSMGVEIIAEHEIKADGKPTIRLADKWRPFEISCAPLPADFGTTTLSAAAEEAIPAEADTQREQLEIAATHRLRETEILRLR